MTKKKVYEYALGLVGGGLFVMPMFGSDVWIRGMRGLIVVGGGKCFVRPKRIDSTRILEETLKRLKRLQQKDTTKAWLVRM